MEMSDILSYNISSTFMLNNTALEFGMTLVYSLAFVDEDTELQDLRKLFQGHTLNLADSFKHFV